MSLAPLKSRLAGVMPREWTRWLDALRLEVDSISSDMVEKNPSATENNIAVYNDEGDIVDSGKEIPSGDVVGTTDTQELSNKSFNELSIANMVNTIICCDGSIICCNGNVVTIV